MVKSQSVATLLFSLWLVAGCSHGGATPGVGLNLSAESGPSNAGHYRCATVSDLNGDGLPDIAAGAFLPGGVSIWYGDGQGKWRVAPRPQVIGDVRSIAAGDLNGDGRTDLAIGGQRDLKGVVVLLQGEDGRWHRGESPTEMGSYESLKCVDINGDGFLDLVGANSSGDLQGGIQVWLGDGRGEWMVEVGPDASHIYRDVEVADINRDGNLDIIGAAWGHSGGIFIFLGSGDGAWSAYSSPARKGDFWGVAATDFNGDGWMDVAATTYYEGIKIWCGSEGGEWAEKVSPVSEGFYWDLLADDFDGDGLTDLAASSADSKGVRLWLGRTIGDWRPVVNALPEDGGYYGMALSDVDGDGRRDLVASSYSEGVKVWLGGGEAVQQPETTTAAASPAAEDQKEAAPLMTRIGVSFEVGAVTPSDSGREAIERIVSLLESTEGAEVRLEGHASSSEPAGEERTLMELSEARALAVRDILSARASIDLGKITVIGYADGQAASDKATEDGAGTARVEVVVTNREETAAAPGMSPEEQDRQSSFEESHSMNGYRIGPGDIVKIILWKHFSADEYEVRVRPDGTLSFPMVDSIAVSGLTVTELDQLLTGKLSHYIKQPKIDVLVQEFHSQEVLVLGAVNALVRQPTGPGVYVLTKPTRIVELITIAGGPRPSANLKKVTVQRQNGTTIYVNIYKAIFQSDVTQDIAVYPGDSIFIPEMSEGMNKIYIFGEVKSPGIYDLKEGMNVLEAVGKAGSFAESAVIDDVRVIRGDISHPKVIPVNFRKLFKSGNLAINVTLRDNDIIYIPRTRIASVAALLKNIRPALDFVLWPYQFEALRTTIDLNRDNIRPLDSSP
jgi:protein involved in polysaccharide export with SLBB domain/outer membrane protein OmpA-like peptidoglycan-associated protein